MSRFRRKAGASRLLARYVRASNGRAGWRAVVGRPKACATGRRAVQSPIWGRAQFWQLSYQKLKCQDIRSIDIDRARMQAESGQWAHRWATCCTDCRLISAPTAAMVALRQPGNRRKSAIFAAQIRVNPCYNMSQNPEQGTQGTRG